MPTHPDRAAGPRATRADDERLLSMLRQRNAGVTMPALAAALGVTKQRIDQLTGAVKRADLAESGEPRDAVLPSYWGR